MLDPDRRESAVYRAIKKAMTSTRKGMVYNMTLTDLILIKQIEMELKSQRLLRPKRCKCVSKVCEK